MSSLLQDLRYALRVHLANPTATLVAVLVLAVGIGANTAIFSVVEGVLLRSLPFREPERLVGVGPIPAEYRSTARQYGTASRFAFETWRDQRDVFEEVAGYVGDDPVLTGLGDATRVMAYGVTANFFPMLGATPMIGRAVIAADTLAGAPRVAVLSHAFWATRLGGAADVVGRTIALNGVPHVVVGVMPPGFRFPERAALWRALAPPTGHSADGSRQPYGGYHTVARLRAGVTPALAMRRLDVTTAAIGQREEGWQGVVANVIPLHAQLMGDVQRPLLLVMGAVAFVLLIACANVANIQLARAVGRRREIAIRVAVGAGRARLLRQLLTESVTLALAGGGLGVLLAYWGVPLLVRLGGEELPGVVDIGVNPRVLAVTLVATLLTGVAFGLAPAVQAARRASAVSLKDGTAGSGASASRNRLGAALVVAQVALTMVLLAGAGLLVASVRHLLRDDAGFTADGVLVAQIELRGTRHTGDTATLAFSRALLERVRAMPGVAAAAMSTGTPLATGAFGTIEVVGGPTPRAAAPTMFTAATADYFRALGIPLLRGRLLRDDGADGPGAIVVSQTLARTYFPGQDPIGRQVRFYGQSITGTIVGVVGDTKAMALDESAPPPHIYQPFAADPAPYLKLVVRAAGDPAALAAGVRAAVRELDPDLPIDALTTMRQLMSESVTRQRFYATLLAVFAAAALVMSAAGIYGVVSYTVTRRTREMGVRLALGATAGDVLRLVFGRAGLLAGAGLLLGGLGALAATRVLRSMLFEIAPTDPRVLGGVAALLAVVALAATWLPARRATRVDPVQALRAE
ncbi:MAG TPA: ABC transporter permease [Gemmatimonadaceae bacterium]|nr:ABC transporter permease [Gemmatimonadaceae bacterium]